MLNYASLWNLKVHLEVQQVMNDQAFIIQQQFPCHERQSMFQPTNRGLNYLTNWDLYDYDKSILKWLIGLKIEFFIAQTSDSLVVSHF